MEITTQGDRILTTHVGSLPRPTSLSTLLISQLTGAQSDAEKSAELIRDSVIKIVETQADVGIDIVSDGEMGKPSYTFYVKNRLAGIQDRGDRMSEIAGSPINRDEREHPTRYHDGNNRVIFLTPELPYPLVLVQYHMKTRATSTRI